METLARFAVPFFFLVSGYCSYQISTQKITKRIKKILILIVFATIFYTVFNVLVIWSTGGRNDVFAYFSKYVDFSELAKLFFFNVPIRLEYFWYLYAMLYVYVIFYFVTKYHVNDKVVFVVSGLILILHVVSGELLSVFGIVLPGMFVRNFAACGIPFFALGLFAKKHYNKFSSVPNFALILSIIVGILASIFSRYFFGKKELYIGSLFVLFAFVCLFIKYSTLKYPKFLTALEGCSTYIYIFHDMISKVIRAIYLAFGININSYMVLKNAHPIIVCVVSTLFAYLLIRILKTAQRHKKDIQCHEG